MGKAIPKEKNYELNDGGGLILRILQSGSKIWVLRYYRPFLKKRTNLTLGKYPTLSLKDARVKREDAKTLLAKNIDPKSHREQEERKHINTFKLVSEQWMDVKNPQSQPSSQSDTHFNSQPNSCSG